MSYDDGYDENDGEQEELREKLEKALSLVPDQCKLARGGAMLIYIGGIPAGHQEIVESFFKRFKGGPQVLKQPSTLPDDLVRQALDSVKRSMRKELEKLGGLRVKNDRMGLQVMLQGCVGDDFLHALFTAFELELDGFPGYARIIVADEQLPPHLGEYPDGVKCMPKSSLPVAGVRGTIREIEEHEGPAQKLTKHDLADFSILLYGKDLDVLDFIAETEKIRGD